MAMISHKHNYSNNYIEGFVSNIPSIRKHTVCGCLQASLKPNKGRDKIYY